MINCTGAPSQGHPTRQRRPKVLIIRAAISACGEGLLRIARRVGGCIALFAPLVAIGWALDAGLPAANRLDAWAELRYQGRHADRARDRERAEPYCRNGYGLPAEERQDRPGRGRHT